MNLSTRQQLAAARLIESRGGLLWWKVGEGKTRIALQWFAMLQHKQSWALPSICLVVCRRKAFYDWTQEIKHCLPDWPVYEDSCPVRPMGKLPCFLLVSEGKLAALQLQLKENWNIRCVVFDEGWLYSNHKSARSKAAETVSAGRFALSLSGTIMKARDTMEIYSQATVVRRQKLLATSPTAFRTKYQICSMGMGFPVFSPRAGAYKSIMSALSNDSDLHFPDNAHRLIHHQHHDIESTPQQAAMFKELRELYSIEAADLEFDHALQVINKTRQIANGWISNSSGDYISVASNKVKKLEEELDSLLSANERVVVWCAFRHDVKMLSTVLPFPSVQMLGGQDFDHERWNSGKVNVCYATEASGSSVNHFAQCAYAIYFSMDYKWISLQQSRGRTDRKSSAHNNCFYKYLHVIGSLDKAICNAANQSGREEKMVIETAMAKQWLTQS